MIWTNYHSHTNFSDGSDEAEKYIQSAIAKKMCAYGFSCHAPVPFQSIWNMKPDSLTAYLNEIRRLKHNYSDLLEVYVGLEIDFVRDCIGFEQFKDCSLDYTIGGIHYLGFMPNGDAWDFDRGKDWFDEGLANLFGGNIRNLVTDYYTEIVKMVQYQRTDVLAHLDLIKKYNGNKEYFNEEDSWYKKLVFDALDVISKSGIIVEINTRGVLNGLHTEFYPSNFVLKRCLELNIPVCLSADTHHPDHVMALLPEARDLLVNLGFREVFILSKEGWIPSSIV